MKIIYVRGGDKTAPEIAKLAGMAYGIRHDYIPYAPIYMLDIHWTNYRWSDYIEKVKRYQPTIAMVPDYEHPSQRVVMMQRAIELKSLVKRVMICPKFMGALDHIPHWALVAVSVPAPSYAGFIPPLHKLYGRNVHLLGGRPEKQTELITKINAVGGRVVSVDGSYMAMKAGKGQYFHDGKWIQSQRGIMTDKELTVISAKAIYTYLHNAQNYQQPMLF